MTEQERQAIRGRCQSSTPGPWAVDTASGGVNVISDHYSDECVGICGNAKNWQLLKGDAEFIAHARQDVPALLAEVERLRAENSQLREGLQTVTSIMRPYKEASDD